ncbi:MAG: MATE family efflux transporter [Anaerolineaceae bacterium]|nr:MATE family efflux transporter [Anaerolineaceae bacterium]
MARFNLQKSNHNNAILEGSIIGSLTRLAVPIVLANVLQTAYQLIDTFWVGRLGAEAVAAVSISFPLIFLMVSLGGGLAVAGSVLVSQFKGRGEPDQVNYYATQTLSTIFLLSIAISVVGYFLTAPILGLLQVEPAVYDAAANYMQVTFVGFTFLFGFAVFQGLLQGVGDVITPLVIVFGTVLLNLLLDPLFIFGWGPIPASGVAGAAWATLGTQGLALIIGIALMIRGKTEIKLERRYLVPRMSAVRRIFTLGFPASVEQSIRALGLTVMTVLVTAFGTMPVAAYGIGTRILSFVIIPALGFSMATSALVGQNIGANQEDRARRIARIAAWITFVLLSVIGVVVFFFAEPITRAFIPDDPAVIMEGTNFIRIFALTFGFIGMQLVLNGAFRGAGNTLAAMIMAIVALWVLRFPVAWVLANPLGMNEQGIWWSFPISNIVAGVLAVAWFSYGRWMRNITSEATVPTQSEAQPQMSSAAD